MDAERLSVGQRIRLYRQRAGKSRPVLGGLVGRSAEWVKAVENGRMLPPRLPMLSRIAQVLKVPVTDLIGGDDIQIDRLAGPGHAALPAVRDALNRYPMGDQEPEPLGHMTARLDAAWRARHASPDHRTVLGGILPGLIHDAQVATRAYDDAERRRAQALLADVLGLTQMFVAYQSGAGDLLWRVADRAMVAALDSGDLRAVAGATWFLMEAHRDAGDWDTAMSINLDALRLIEPRLADGDDDLLALFGALEAGAAFTAARAGEEGNAWRHWDVADRVARRLPEGYHQTWTWFSPPVVAFYGVSVGVELRKAGVALRHALRTPAERITSRPRRARHLIEVARAHHLRREHDETAHTLDLAHATAPETIRWNSYARQMVLDLLDGPSELRRKANDLAVKVGVLTG